MNKYMINYELTLKLEKAGFPQKQSKEFYSPDCDCGLAAKYRKEEIPYEPLLSELIEACGESFKGLIFDFDYFGDKEDRWFAGTLAGEDFKAFIDKEYSYGKGSTPEEAVANLFLALNKK